MSSDCEGVNELLQTGFLPVLHGDCVLDEELGCTILSGDTIMQVSIWCDGITVFL